jgi:hypothetical protein
MLASIRYILLWFVQELNLVEAIYLLQSDTKYSYIIQLVVLLIQASVLPSTALHTTRQSSHSV